MSSFPAVSAKVLSEFVHDELKLNVSADEISNPNATVAHNCFIAFLSGLSGVTEESINRQKSRAVGQMEYKEMFEGSYTLLVLFREIKEMMKCATIPDFCLADMTRPNKTRFKRQLSALHNFWGHRHDRLQEYVELTARSEDLLDEREQLKHEIAVKEEEIAKIKSQRQREEPEVEEVLEHNAQLERTLHRLKEEQEKGLRELEAITDKKDRMEKDRLAVEEETHRLITDVEKLKQRIRQSPDELMRKVKDAEQRLQKAKAELEDKEKVLAAHIKKRDNMFVLEEDLKSVMAVMQQIQTEQQRNRKEQQAIEELKASIAAAELELSELQFQQKQVNQKIDVDQARAERLKQALEQKRALWEKRADEFEAELAHSQSLKADKLREVADKERGCKDLERSIEDLQLKHRAAALRMREEKEALSRLADSYMHSISQSLGIAV